MNITQFKVVAFFDTYNINIKVTYVHIYSFNEKKKN